MESTGAIFAAGKSAVQISGAWCLRTQKPGWVPVWQSATKVSRQMKYPAGSGAALTLPKPTLIKRMRESG